jgi:hypothetical protein
MAGVALGGRIAASLLPSPCRFGCLSLGLEGVRRRNCVVFAYIPRSRAWREFVVGTVSFLSLPFGLCVECVDDFC